ncbi:unnamed protein product [Lymnaea stagnalis]|uniref:RNase NYN domain-containing protein n=1 Tax=Lymnaea stagnalis TaxID=6523 RepID=A0AAV2H7E2_LYMST
MTTQEQTIDFVIDLSCSPLVQKNVARIQALFNVKVHFSHVAEAYPKVETKQWIEITGLEDNNRNNARDYILAIVSPQSKIKLQKIRSNPLYTSKSRDQIEKESCAVLADCDENGLIIEGSDIAVVKALSMIDEMFHGININDSENTETDKDHDWVWVDKDEVENGSTSQNKNNSSLTPAMVLDTTSIYNSDSFKKAQNTISKDQGTKAVANGLDNTMHVDIEHDGLTRTTNILPAASSFSRQGPIPLSSQTRNYVSYASPSALSPDQEPMIVNPTHTAQISLQSTITPRGDGIFKSWSQYGSENQQVGRRPLPDVNASKVPTSETEQAKYLTALARDLHYKQEDIEVALSMYSMKDIVVPAEFLETVKNVKASRHKGGQCVNYSSALQPRATQVKEFSANDGNAADVIVISDEEMEDDFWVGVPPAKDKRKTVPVGPGPATASHRTFATANEYSQELASRSQTRLTQVQHGDAGKGDKSQNVQVQRILDATRQPKPGNILEQRKESLKPSGTDGLVKSVSGADSLDTSGSDYEVNRPLKSFRKDLRYIVIDGSNVAMLHGDNKEFSVYGLEICINYFRRRGHDRITAFVPESRRYSENRAPIRGRRLLEKLSDDGYVKFTPARRVNGKTIASYDDRYILSLAEKEDGIVVSNDQFRDLCLENPSYRNIVERRLLQFMFVNNHFMPPDDPLGRYGPHLDQFLRTTSIPSAVTATRNVDTNQKEETTVKQVEPARPNGPFGMLKLDQKPGRGQQLTQKLFEQLIAVFPDPNQSLRVYSVLQNHPQETDINRLTNYVLSFLSD